MLLWERGDVYIHISLWGEQGLNVASPPGRFHPQPARMAPTCSSLLLWCPFSCGFEMGEGTRGNEQGFRQAIAVEWMVKGYGTMSEKQSNPHHMLNSLLPGEVAGTAPQALPSEFCITWVESSDWISWAFISAASRCFLAPSKKVRTHMLPPWGCLWSLWAWNLNLFLSPLPSAAYLMSSIFPVCRGASGLKLTQIPQKSSLYFPPSLPHHIHAKCN